MDSSFIMCSIKVFKKTYHVCIRLLCKIFILVFNNKRYNRIVIVLYYFLKPGSIFPTQFFIGIKYQNPITRCIFQRIISSLAEAAFPWMVENLCPITLCNLDSSICRTGVYDYYFIYNIPDTIQASRKILFLILYNHTE